MNQDMAEDECSGAASEGKDGIEGARALTYDEAKAAEAAFRGQPFNPAWSAAAAQVYTGILTALTKREAAGLSQAATEDALEHIGC